jgi:chemotaxis signal transduction protein
VLTGFQNTVVIGGIGENRYALPAMLISRVLAMAALTPLADAPPGVIGLLNLHGDILPVVDPRPRLHLPTPAFHPDQRLLVVTTPNIYLLWLDRVDDVLVAQPEDFHAVAVSPNAHPLSPSVLSVGGELIPVLSLEALNPGPIIESILAVSP